MTYKSEAFAKELVYIKDETVRKFAVEAIETMPDYFFRVAASSTGKYHPAFALGDGGLLRHTRAAVRVAIELLRLDWWHFTDREIDLMLVALMLHDGWKHGIVESKYTVTDHPIIAANAIKSNINLISKGILPPEDIEFILSNIRSHMGQWVFDYKTHEKVLDRPENKYQKFVHLSDYMASRKCLEMNFDVELSKD